MFGSITNEALTIYSVGITAFAIVTNTAWAKSAEGAGAAFIMPLMMAGVCWGLFVFSIGIAAFVRLVGENGWL